MMTRRDFVRSLSAAGLSGWALWDGWSVSEARPSEKPNILYILADDLGYGDLHCLNPERGKIPTPNIDGLASQGVIFTEAHSSAAVCSPSRYSVLTGRYNWRSRLQKGIVEPWGEPMIGEARLTVPGLLRERGYTTSCVGKWHLGWNWQISDAERDGLNRLDAGPGGQKAFSYTPEQQEAWRAIFSRSIPGGPLTRGFDHYFGVDVPNWPPYSWIQEDRTTGIPSELLPKEKLQKNQASKQGPAMPGWRLEEILPRLGDEACRVIREGSSNEKPFFLYLPLTSPHTPLAVNEEWKGKSGLGPYADFVMETDALIGRVVAELEKSGQAENTLVFFTSDNGCAPYIGVSDMEKSGHYPSENRRGYKADAWDGGHRIPLIVRWPDVVKPGTSCRQMVCLSDLMATCVDILDAKLPDEAGEDSFSMLPLLKGKDKPIRDSLVSHSITGKFAIRDDRWKLLLCAGSGGWASPKDEEAVRDGLPPVQLHDMTQDIGERKNLEAEHPEVVERLTKLLEKVVADGRSTPGAPQKNDVAVDIWKTV